MARGEIHIQLSVDYADDPKIIAAGEKAEVLYLRALCLAKRTLSDGFVADVQLPRFGLAGVKARAAALVRAGLWERVDGGYQIAAWLKRNKSRAEVESESEAGSLGNHIRWHARRGIVADGCPHCDHDPESPPDRPPTRPRSSPRIPETETETETETSPPPSADNAPPAPPTSEGEGSSIVDQAVQLAAQRYGEAEHGAGRGRSAAGLARWWLQENADGARIRGERLLATHDLTATQLADALASATDPSWLRSYRRRATTPDPEPDVDQATVAAIQDGIRDRLRHPHHAEAS